MAVASKDYGKDIIAQIIDLKRRKKEVNKKTKEIKDKIVLIEYPGTEAAKTFNQVLGILHLPGLKQF